MTAWLAASVVVGIACAALLVALSRASGELEQTRRALGGFRAGMQPALVRVRTEAEAARQRLGGRGPHG